MQYVTVSVARTGKRWVKRGVARGPRHEWFLLSPQVVRKFRTGTGPSVLLRLKHIDDLERLARVGELAIDSADSEGLVAHPADIARSGRFGSAPRPLRRRCVRSAATPYVPRPPRLARMSAGVPGGSRKPRPAGGRRPSAPTPPRARGQARPPAAGRPSPSCRRGPSRRLARSPVRSRPRRHRGAPPPPRANRSRTRLARRGAAADARGRAVDAAPLEAEIDEAVRALYGLGDRESDSAGKALY